MEAFSLPFQMEACNLYDAGQLFPNQLPAGQEPEPHNAGDAVDLDGNALPSAKQTNRVCCPGSNNKPKAAAQTASASAESADAKVSAAQPRKRGRPAGSKNKVKPGQSTAGKGRARGRSRCRGRPKCKMQRIYSDASDAGNATSGNNSPGQAEQSDDASLGSSYLSSSQSDSHISISDCSTVHSSSLDSDLASLSDASGKDSVVAEEAAVPEDTGIDDFENYDSDE